MDSTEYHYHDLDRASRVSNFYPTEHGIVGPRYPCYLPPITSNFRLALSPCIACTRDPNAYFPLGCSSQVSAYRSIPHAAYRITSSRLPPRTLHRILPLPLPLPIPPILPIRRRYPLLSRTRVSRIQHSTLPLDASAASSHTRLPSSA